MLIRKPFKLLILKQAINLLTCITDVIGYATPTSYLQNFYTFITETIYTNITLLSNSMEYYAYFAKYSSRWDKRLKTPQPSRNRQSTQMWDCLLPPYNMNIQKRRLPSCFHQQNCMKVNVKLIL